MRTFLFVALFLINFTLFAQSDISYGKSQQLNEDMRVSTVVGSSNSGIYFMTENDQGQLNGLAFVSHSGDQFKSVTITDCFHENLFALVVNNELHTFITTQKDNELQLIRNKYNSQLKLIKTEVFLSHTKVSARAIGHFKHAKSPDGSKFAILQETPQEKGNPEILHCHVYEINGNKIWEKEFTTKVSQSLKPINQIEMNNAGDVFVLKRIRKGVEFFFTVYNFYDHGKSVKPHRLDLKGPKITEIVMSTTSNNNLIVAGMYSNSTIDRSEGYFYAIYEPSGKQVLMSSKKIDESQMLEFKDGKKTNKKEAPLSNVYVEDVVTTSNGFYLIFEPIIDIAHKIKNSTHFDQEHIYGSIMAMFVTNDGDVEDFIHVAKNQNSWNDEGFFGSFYAKANENMVQIITTSFDADSKSRTNNYPFNKTIIVGFSSDKSMDEQFLKLDLKENLISPLLISQFDSELHLILTDKTRQKVLPAQIK